jgi:hypothetical protein
LAVFLIASQYFESQVNERSFSVKLTSGGKVDDNKGKEQGIGELIYAAKVTVLEGNKVEVENYGIDPVKMIGVRKF